MAASLTVGSPDGGAAPTSPLRVAAALYTLFVVYGCLVPLDFTPVPWSEAWASYRHIPEFRPGPSSRTDFTANVLLFLPLAFLWAGSIGAGWRRLGAISKSLLVWTAAVLFQAALEFAQVYAPPRSVSLWDVLAAACGAAIGVAAWSAAGGAVRRALERWSAARGRQGVAGWLVAPYSIFLLLYNVIPADLTLNAASLLGKWDHGLIRPIPFTSLGGDPVTAGLGLAAEALLWMPLAALLVIGGRARGFAAWGLTVLFAVGVEAVQLLVRSRVSDSTDVLSAAAGAGAGVLVALRLRRDRAADEASGADFPHLLLASLLAAVAWTALLVAGYCYPFDFHYQASELPARIDALTAIPFRSYWLATEARAFSDLLTQLALFAPFGALAALAMTRVKAPWAGRAGALASLLAAGAVAGGIEALQLFLPRKVPDSTDILAAAIGGLGGYAATRAIQRALRRDTPSTTDAPSGAPAARSRRSRRAAKMLTRTLIATILLLAAAFIAAESPAVPYNVRELFAKGGHLALLGFPLAVLAAFTPPMLFARWCAQGAWGRAAILPVFVLGHALVVWTGIRIGAPMEAIHDIVGSPILHWPGDLEIMGRFLALFGAVTTLFTGGALLAALLVEPRPGSSLRALARWFVLAIPLLLVSHLIVVRAASTDNLVELMAGGGTLLSSICLGAWLLNAAVGASALAAVMRQRAKLLAAAAVLAAGVPFGWAALTLGTEPVIVKYGDVFSAMQFLFSADRAHYASGSELLTRYVLAHAGVVAMAALVQMPFAGHRRQAGAARQESP